MRRLLQAASLAGAATCLAACSSSTTTSASTASLATLQQSYRAAVAPVNTAIATYDARMASRTASRADLITATTDVIGRLEAMGTALGRIPFPASMAGDVGRVVAAATALTDKLRTGTDAEIMKADVDLTTAVAALRTDLHLPVVSGG